MTTQRPRKLVYLVGGAAGSATGGVIAMAVTHDTPWFSLWLLTVLTIAALVSWAEDKHKDVERYRDALGLLRGHVVDDEGWKLINDALWLGARDENGDPNYA